MAYSAFADYGGTMPKPKLPSYMMASAPAPTPGGPYIGTSPPPAPAPTPAAPSAPAASAPYPGGGPATIQRPGDLPPDGSETPFTPTTLGAVPNPAQSINNDPGYLLAQSEDFRNQGDAASNYLSGIEQSLLGFGSQELAQKVLEGMRPELEANMRAAGSLGSGDHIDLGDFYKSFYLHDAQGNPILGADGQPLMINDRNQGFSQLAQLGRGAFNATKNQINENRLGNLAYSTAGAQGLADTAYNNQLSLNNAANTENAALGQFLQGYRGSLSQSRSQLNSAAQSAWDRLTQQAIANHEGPPPPAPPDAPATTGSSTKTAKPKPSIRPQTGTAYVAPPPPRKKTAAPYRGPH